MLRTGDQVPADGTVPVSLGLEIDQSLLTGESDPIAKAAHDLVRSGSIVVAGQGRVQTTAVAADAAGVLGAVGAMLVELTHRSVTVIGRLRASRADRVSAVGCLY